MRPFRSVRQTASVQWGSRGGRLRPVARKRAVAGLTVRYNQNFEDLVDKYCAYGTVQDCAETIRQYVEAGVTHVELSPLVPAGELRDQVSLWSEELLPLFRGVSGVG